MTNFVRSHSTSLHPSSKLDRCGATLPKVVGVIVAVALLAGYVVINFFTSENKAEIFDPITATVERCLLYTSDAADDYWRDCRCCFTGWIRGNQLFYQREQGRDI